MAKWKMAMPAAWIMWVLEKAAVTGRWDILNMPFLTLEEMLTSECCEGKGVAAGVGRKGLGRYRWELSIQVF